MNGRLDSDGFTGLELVILAGALIFTVAVLLLLSGGGDAESNGNGHQGFIVSMHRMTSESIRPVGSVAGFSAIDTTQNGVPILFRQHDRTKIGAVSVTVALFMGNSGSIDMNRATVAWMMNGQTEKIQKTSLSPLICPNWTIAQKLSGLPGESANTNDILEPNEQFVLIICPLNGTAAYQQFTVVISPSGDALPLPLSLTAPARIQPVMILN